MLGFYSLLFKFWIFQSKLSKDYPHGLLSCKVAWLPGPYQPNQQAYAFLCKFLQLRVFERLPSKQPLDVLQLDVTNLAITVFKKFSLWTIRCCTWFRFWLCSLLITEIVILSCNFTSQLPIVRNEIFLKNWTFGLPYTSQEADTGLIWEISLVHEYLMKMLPENVIIRKIYRGTLLLV